MKMLRSIVTVVLTLSFTLPTFACTEDGKSGILPDNDLYIPVTKDATTMSKDEFVAIINKVFTIYSPIVARTGRKLRIQYNWTDGTVNASAMPGEDNTALVKMYGGMARHPEMTKDGFALVVCHELGHHIGGAPRKVASRWASSEGQSDYFASLKCLRRVFQNDNNAALIAGKQFPKTLVDSCKAAWKGGADYYICIRSGMAGLSLSKVFQSTKRAPTAPNFATPSRAVVAVSYDDHPHYQCRLDTYFQGALCQVDERIDVSNTDEKQGVCHRANGDTVGNRPSCWYKSR